MNLNKVRCGFCNGSLFWGDGIYAADDCRWYHEKCADNKASKRRIQLDKKFRAGTITLDEARELSDLNILLQNFNNDPITIPLSAILGEPSIKTFRGNTFIAKQNLYQRTNKRQVENIQ